MLGPVDRALAYLGIGAYYLHKDYVWAERYEIEGPYKHPFNPYGGHRLYGMNSRSVFHLLKPKGEITPPSKEIK